MCLLPSACSGLFECVCYPQLVVDWLEKNAVTMMEKNPVKINYFADSVCWENTLHSIQRNMDHDRIISEMVSGGAKGMA